jgi:hypothetical protein
MWSFLASVIVFVVLVVGLGFWRRFTHREIKRATVSVDQQISAAADVAQRRHVQRFGHASADLAKTLNGSAHYKS